MFPCGFVMGVYSRQLVILVQLVFQRRPFVVFLRKLLLRVAYESSRDRLWFVQENSFWGLSLLWYGTLERVLLDGHNICICGVTYLGISSFFQGTAFINFFAINGWECWWLWSDLPLDWSSLSLSRFLVEKRWNGNHTQISVTVIKSQTSQRLHDQI